MPRLDQLLASLGYGSRREMREWVDAGRVAVDGAPADDAARRVEPAAVRVDGEPLDHPEGLLLLLHKPLGVVCSRDAGEGPSVYDLLPERWRRRNPAVTTVGRLDKETTGALLLTDQAALIHRLTSPRHKVPKVYRATLDRAPPDDVASALASGTLLLTGEKEPCAPAAFRCLDALIAELTITEGRYHQVRRMFASQGCAVLALHRVRFGALDLGALAPGQYQELPINFDFSNLR